MIVLSGLFFGLTLVCSRSAGKLPCSSLQRAIVVRLLPLDAEKRKSLVAQLVE